LILYHRWNLDINETSFDSDKKEVLNSGNPGEFNSVVDHQNQSQSQSQSSAHRYDSGVSNEGGSRSISISPEKSSTNIYPFNENFNVNENEFGEIDQLHHINQVQVQGEFNNEFNNEFVIPHKNSDDNYRITDEEEKINTIIPSQKKLLKVEKDHSDTNSERNNHSHSEYSCSPDKKPPRNIHNVHVVQKIETKEKETSKELKKIMSILDEDV